jgi:iron(III) transport system permease protein
MLAGATAAIATALALFVAFTARLAPGRATRAASRIATLGYAVPGAVVALGAILACAELDRAIAVWRGGPRELVLGGSYLALVWVCASRFCAVAHGAIESGFARLGPHVEEAALTLGARPSSLLVRVSAPLVKGSIAAGFVLAFVDAAKELPATLMMQPIGCETLAIRAYKLAENEEIACAAPYALAIVVLGLVPVAIAERLAR